MNTQDRYKDKILGIRNYRHSQYEFFVKDFIDLDLFEPILEEILMGESDMTPAGKQFLQEYYGLEKLAEILHTRGKMRTVSLDCGDAQKIESVLADIVPMEMTTFVETARGTIGSGAKVRDDLLPPQQVQTIHCISSKF